MFGIGTLEFLVIILVAVLALGPEHLPRVVRTVTRVMSDFRRISTDVQRAITFEANKEEYRQRHGDEAFESSARALRAGKKVKKKKKTVADGGRKTATQPSEDAALTKKASSKKTKRTQQAEDPGPDASLALAGKTAPSGRSGPSGNGKPPLFSTSGSAGLAGNTVGADTIPAVHTPQYSEFKAEAPGGAPRAEAPADAFRADFPGGASGAETPAYASGMEAPNGASGPEAPADASLQKTDEQNKLRSVLRSAPAIDPDSIPTQGGRA